MLRLLRLVFVLTLVLVVGLVAIISLTYRNTNRFAYLFTNPDGTRCETPCLFGADPINMRLEQVDKIWLASPVLLLARRAESTAPAIAYWSDHIHAGAGGSSEVHTSVYLTSDSLTLGELFVLFGKPQRILFIRRNLESEIPNQICDMSIFFIEGRMVELHPQKQANCMSPYQKVSGFSLKMPDPLYLKLSVLWGGFNTDDFYETMLKQTESNN